MAVEINNEMDSISQQSGGRIYGFGAIAVQEVEASVRELDRMATTLKGIRGIILGTSGLVSCDDGGGSDTTTTTITTTATANCIAAADLTTTMTSHSHNRHETASTLPTSIPISASPFPSHITCHSRHYRCREVGY